MKYVRVSKYDLDFQWQHHRQPGPCCVIKYQDTVVKCGWYEDMAELFYDLTEDNPESTVAVDLDYETNRLQSIPAPSH